MAFALVDCESFYASCERIFRPDLKNIPIVVLSNNDGCVIARSTLMPLNHQISGQRLILWDSGDETKKHAVTFVSMDINCHISGQLSDDIEIRDGKSDDSPHIVNLCGNVSTTPEFIETTQSYMRVR